MKKCNVVCGFNPYIVDPLEGLNIGVDAGCRYLIKMGIIPDVAIGDFDSIKKEELAIIQNLSKKFIKLNPIKDDTDLEHALNYLKDEGFEDIHIYGCLGGRQDHNLLNFKLLYLSDLNITMYDYKHKITVLKEGTYVINKNNYKYLSFLTLDKCRISLKGTFYPLDNQMISLMDNYTVSNEILNDSCELVVHQGKILLIQCND